MSPQQQNQNHTRSLNPPSDILVDGEIHLTKWSGTVSSLRTTIKKQSSSSASSPTSPKAVRLHIGAPAGQQQQQQENDTSSYESDVLNFFLDLVQFAPKAFRINEIVVVRSNNSNYKLSPETQRAFRVGLEIARVRDQIISNSDTTSTTTNYEFFDQFFNFLRGCHSSSSAVSMDGDQELDDIELSITTSSLSSSTSSSNIAALTQCLKLLNVLFKHASMADVPSSPVGISSFEIGLPRVSNSSDSSAALNSFKDALSQLLATDDDDDHDNGFDFTRLFSLETVSFEGLSSVMEPTMFENIIRRILRHVSVSSSASPSSSGSAVLQLASSSRRGAPIGKDDFASSLFSRSQVDRKQRLLLDQQEDLGSSYNRVARVQNLALRSSLPSGKSSDESSMKKRSAILRLICSFLLERDNVSLVTLDLRDNDLSSSEVLQVVSSALLHPNLKEIHYDDKKGPLVLDLSRSLRTSLRKSLLLSSSNTILTFDLDSSSSSSNNSNTSNNDLSASRRRRAAANSKKQTTREGAETCLRILQLALERTFENRVKTFEKSKSHQQHQSASCSIHLRGYSFSWSDAISLINFLNDQTEKHFESVRSILRKKNPKQVSSADEESMIKNIIQNHIIGTFNLSFARLSSSSSSESALSDFVLLSDIADALSRKSENLPRTAESSFLLFTNSCLKTLQIEDLVKRSLQKLQHDERNTGERSISSPLAKWPLLPLVDQQVWRIVRLCDELIDFNFYPLPSSYSVSFSNPGDLIEQDENTANNNNNNSHHQINAASADYNLNHGDEPLEHEFVGYYSPPPARSTTAEEEKSTPSFSLPSPLPRHLEPNVRALHLRKLQHNIKALLFVKTENKELYLNFVDVVCGGDKGKAKEITFSSDATKKCFVSDRLLVGFRNLVLGSDLFNVVETLRFVFQNAPIVADSSSSSSPTTNQQKKKSFSGSLINRSSSTPIEQQKQQQQDHELSRQGVESLFRCLKACVNLSTLDVGETSRFTSSPSSPSKQDNSNNNCNFEWASELLEQAIHLFEESHSVNISPSRQGRGNGNSNNNNKNTNKRITLLNDGAEVVHIDADESDKDLEKEILFNKELDSLLGKLKGAELEQFGTPIFKSLLPLAECHRDKITTLLQQLESERQQPQAVKVVLQQQQQQAAIAEGASSSSPFGGGGAFGGGRRQTNANRRGSHILGGGGAGGSKSTTSGSGGGKSALESQKEKERDSNTFILDAPSNTFGPPPHVHGILRYQELAVLLFHKWSSRATARWRTLALPHCAIGNKGAQLVFKFLDEGGRACPSLRIRKLDLRNNEIELSESLMGELLAAVESVGLVHVDIRGNTVASSSSCLSLLHDFIYVKRATPTLTSLLLPEEIVDGNNNNKDQQQQKLLSEIKRVLMLNQNTLLRAKVAHILGGQSTVLDIPGECGDTVFESISQDLLASRQKPNLHLTKISVRNCRLTDKSLPILERLCVEKGGSHLKSLDVSLNNFTPTLLLQTITKILKTLEEKFEFGGSLKAINISLASTASASSSSSATSSVCDGFVSALQSQHKGQLRKFEENKEAAADQDDEDDDGFFGTDDHPSGAGTALPPPGEFNTTSHPIAKKNLNFTLLADGWQNIFFDERNSPSPTTTRETLKKIITSSTLGQESETTATTADAVDLDDDVAVPTLSYHKNGGDENDSTISIIVKTKITSPISMRKLCQALSNGNSREVGRRVVTKLSFSAGASSSINCDGWEDLFDCISKKYPHIEYFNAVDCNWTAEVLKAFLETNVSANPALTHIDLSENPRLFTPSTDDQKKQLSSANENENIYGVLIRVLASENANLRHLELRDSLPSSLQNFNELIRSKILVWNSLGTTPANSAIIKKDLIWIEQDLIFSLVRDVCKVNIPEDTFLPPPAWFKTLFPKIASIAPPPLVSSSGSGGVAGGASSPGSNFSNPFASGRKDDDDTTTSQQQNNNNNNSSSIYPQFSWTKGIATDAAVSVLCDSLRSAYERMNYSFIPTSVLYQYQQQLTATSSSSAAATANQQANKQGNNNNAGESPEFGVGRPRRRKMMFSEDEGGDTNNTTESSPPPAPQQQATGSDEQQQQVSPKRLAQERAHKLNVDPNFFPIALLDLSYNPGSNITSQSVECIFNLLCDLTQKQRSVYHQEFLAMSAASQNRTGVMGLRSGGSGDHHHNHQKTPPQQRQPSPPLTAKTEAHSPSRRNVAGGRPSSASMMSNSNNHIEHIITSTAVNRSFTQDELVTGSGAAGGGGGAGSKLRTDSFSSSPVNASHNETTTANHQQHQTSISSASSPTPNYTNKSAMNKDFYHQAKFSLCRHICLDGNTYLFDSSLASSSSTGVDDLLIGIMLANPSVTISIEKCNIAASKNETLSRVQYLSLCNAQPGVIRSLLLNEEEFVNASSQQQQQPLLVMPSTLTYFPLNPNDVNNSNKSSATSSNKNKAGGGGNWKINQLAASANLADLNASSPIEDSVRAPATANTIGGITSASVSQNHAATPNGNITNSSSSTTTHPAGAGAGLTNNNNSDPLQDDACLLLRQVLVKVSKLPSSASTSPRIIGGQQQDSSSPSLQQPQLPLVNRNILHLKLPRNEITANGCVDLITGLCALPPNQLLTLDLSDNKIGDAAARPIMSKLILNHCKHSIKTVNLAGNYFGDTSTASDGGASRCLSVDVFIAGLEELREQKKNKNKNKNNRIPLEHFDVSGCTGLSEEQTVGIGVACRLLYHTPSHDEGEHQHQQQLASLMDLCSSVFEGVHSIASDDFTKKSSSADPLLHQLLPLFLVSGILSQSFTSMKTLDFSKLAGLKDEHLGWMFTSSSPTRKEDPQGQQRQPQQQLFGVFCGDDEDRNGSGGADGLIAAVAPPALPVLQYTAHHGSLTSSFSSLLNQVLILSPQLTSLDLSNCTGLSLKAVAKIYAESAPFVSEAKMVHLISSTSSNSNSSSSSSLLSTEEVEFLASVCETTSIFAASNGLKCTIGPFSGGGKQNNKTDADYRSALKQYQQQQKKSSGGGEDLEEVFVSLVFKGHLVVC